MVDQAPSTPIFFATAGELRAWFEANHTTATELFAGYYKKATGRPSPTWAESVDEALCVGWIDGIRRSLDGERYVQRFTPRKASSTWSNVNVARVHALTAEGRMQPAGLAAFARRREARTGIYSAEQPGSISLGDAFEARFQSTPAAWAWFNSQPAGYRKSATWWVISPKQEATRLRRLETLIDDSANQRRIALLRRTATPS